MPQQQSTTDEEKEQKSRCQELFFLTMGGGGGGGVLWTHEYSFQTNNRATVQKRHEVEEKSATPLSFEERI